MEKLLKDDFQAFLAEYDRPSYNGLRVNTLKISVEDFLRINPFHLTPVPWCSNGFYYSDEDDPSRHPYYHAGLYYLQEPSAMAPAAFLPVEHGNVILDGCSAPGGKASELAARLNNTGLLVSNDISASRQKATLHNLEKTGVRNCYVISEDLDRLSDKYSSAFDKILLDAPCSGEGMFRKDPSLISSWLNNGPDYYCVIQKRLIRQAYGMLKAGGLLMYSTCTFSPKENEMVIQEFMNDHADMEIIPLKHDCFAEGLIPGTARLYPHRLHGEGHFMALLRKKGELCRSSFTFLPDRITNEEFHQFMKLTDIRNKNYRIINDNIYLLPEAFLPTDGIRVLRSGLLLGEMKNNHFEPSQALAMALREDEFAKVISLSCSDELVTRYLKGETIEVEDDINGWALVCADHFPLGFGKVQKHRLKNKIDKGWRRL